MDIDLAALRMLEREKEIPMSVLVAAIEQALLIAYHRTEGAQSDARVELDRQTGHVVVWAREKVDPDDPASATREVDDTPDGFGRIAASTARQVILQRLRDVEDEAVLGEFRGREGDIVGGVIQQGPDPRAVLVDLGSVEGVLMQTEQVPGERYVHGERLRCFVLAVRKGPKGPQVQAVAVAPQPGAQAVRARGARDRRRQRRDHGPGPRGGAPHKARRPHERRRPEPQGRLHRPDGAAGARGDVRACTARRSTSSTGTTTPRGSWRRRCRRRGSARWWSPTAPPARPG
ncbi:hypothetical protein GCM10025868_07800 [Angustibacter aerolatus]|uniref:Transcription factor NusA N-terminal domain-containing protein n=1 Tax=Angustibacter aerolatus TaxID=1162965 RepID=A0ABQ6JBH9_9ACTN|nr:NusA N-terminal domain-containing protein [Angustibacter aerolatus]GMA85530.1 hypothetical protein GCM10025868_07800 [Angustibacter aerolatus]